ncbi:anti-sigma factor family protein [Teredinibacter waterburyi]|jgi:hypothetical protein|uniref:anti-sigma factor family protein n=1 Tax=Teredinibacter waterburyi TaxID=1500538 RepID=UPI00165EEA2F|nr:hypothetical protein [Teredinibacter waterburyi]
MKITDETLSAFLDAQLTDREMDQVRDRIASDERLANRLAELAENDALVRATYSAIDQQPLPNSITDLLSEKAPADNVVQLSVWQRLRSSTQKNLAVAASITFALGFAISHFSHSPKTDSPKTDSPTADSWVQVVQALNDTPSGKAVNLVGFGELTPRVSFTDAEGDLCRQFTTRTDSETTQALACINNGKWQKLAAFTTAATGAGNYQPATVNNPINDLVDQLAKGPFLNAEQEAQAIENNWQK